MNPEHTVSISPEYLRELMDAKLSLSAIRREREQERESWERVYQHRESGCHFIIRTLDGQLCYVPQGTNGARSARLNKATGRRELLLMCREPVAPFTYTAADSAATIRKIRTYVETDEQIMGVPIFAEVHPEDRS